MDVYRGADKVAEFESYDELRVGANKPAFIYEGAELVYPNPVKDGLVLWYDFSGRTNSDAQRDVAEDLSGNGNHGTLQNFNFTAESGYDKNKLLFDGVDDSVITQSQKNWVNQSEITAEIVFISNNNSNITLLSNDYRNFEIALRSNGSVQAYYSNGVAANYRQPSAEGNYSDGKIHYIAIVFLKAEDTVIFYDSGKEISRYTHFDQLDMTGELITSFNLGSRPPNQSRIFTGEIFSTRIYNKKLTPEEIAHNYAIEKERFNL